MRSLTYLNVVLSLIAVLLTAVLWTMWSNPAVDLTASARAQGLTDPGAQRAAQIDQLKSINQKVEELTRLFKSGQARVRLENAPGDDKGH